MTAPHSVLTCRNWLVATENIFAFVYMAIVLYFHRVEDNSTGKRLHCDDTEIYQTCKVKWGNLERKVDLVPTAQGSFI